MNNYKIDQMVKIAGTDYDRRRKLTNNQLSCIKKDYNNGVSICELAVKYGVAANTIHYHVDEEYKKFHNQRRKYSTRTITSKSTIASRIAFKKRLLSSML